VTLDIPTAQEVLTRLVEGLDDEPGVIGFEPSADEDWLGLATEALAFVRRSG
jgi:hypothetical protein